MTSQIKDPTDVNAVAEADGSIIIEMDFGETGSASLRLSSEASEEFIESFVENIGAHFDATMEAINKVIEHRIAQEEA